MFLFLCEKNINSDYESHSRSVAFVILTGKLNPQRALEKKSLFLLYSCCALIPHYLAWEKFSLSRTWKIKEKQKNLCMLWVICELKIKGEEEKSSQKKRLPLVASEQERWATFRTTKKLFNSIVQNKNNSWKWTIFAKLKCHQHTN